MLGFLDCYHRSRQVFPATELTRHNSDVLMLSDLSERTKKVRKASQMRFLSFFFTRPAVRFNQTHTFRFILREDQDPLESTFLLNDMKILDRIRRIFNRERLLDPIKREYKRLGLAHPIQFKDLNLDDFIVFISKEIIFNYPNHVGAKDDLQEIKRRVGFSSGILHDLLESEPVATLEELQGKWKERRGFFSIKNSIIRLIHRMYGSEPCQQNPNLSRFSEEEDVQSIEFRILKRLCVSISANHVLSTDALRSLLQKELEEAIQSGSIEALSQELFMETMDSRAINRCFCSIQFQENIKEWLAFHYLKNGS